MMIDTHVEETINRWKEMEQAEHAYRRWAAFFYPLIDKPETGRQLCELGLSVIRRQIAPGAEARSAVERILRLAPNPQPIANSIAIGECSQTKVQASDEPVDDSR